VRSKGCVIDTCDMQFVSLTHVTDAQAGGTLHSCLRKGLLVKLACMMRKTGGKCYMQFV
jgi:hypothetical protein